MKQGNTNNNNNNNNNNIISDLLKSLYELLLLLPGKNCDRNERALSFRRNEIII
jgi:hypothetical protein